MGGVRPQLILALSCLALQSALAIVCYHCDSIALPSCAQTLGEVGVLPFKECPTELTCVMSIVDGITYRGCGAETPTTQSTYAKRCSSNLCNAGVYPPGRLKCHHCSGESCVDVPPGRPLPCLQHVEEDHCYTEVINPQLAYRGCLSDSNHTASDAAKLCDFNGCNEELGAWTLNCVSCDSAQRLGCKMDLFQQGGSSCNISEFDQCQLQLLLGSEEDKYCFSYHNLSRVVRGCSSDVPIELAAYRDELLQCTTADHCNAGCMPQQQCLSCNSASEELCRSNASALSSSYCGSAEVSSCFSCEYDDWSVQRGCGSPPTDELLARCYECDSSTDKGCNVLDFSRCYRCSSDGEAGAACANWEQPGGIYIEECVQPATPCLVVSYQNGSTSRGCQRKDFDCSSTDAMNCQSCAGSFCNKGAFPEQRLWCHQCTNCDRIQSAQAAIPCAVPANEPANLAEYCLEYYDQLSRQVVRGCRSNATLYYECMLRSEGGNCRLCQHHGCNDSPRVELLTGQPVDEHQALGIRSAASSLRALTSITAVLSWFSIIIYQVIS